VEFEITVREYYERLAGGFEPLLINGVTKGCGALYDAKGNQLFYSDIIVVKG